MNAFNIRRLALMCAVLVCTGSTWYSCKKKDPEPSNQQLGMPVPNYPKPADADAVLVAVKAATPASMNIPSIPGMPSGSNEIEMELGLGIAYFKGNARADLVKLNDTELKFQNGAHLWMPDFTNVLDPSSLTGINLNGTLSWRVTNPNIEKNLSGIPSKPKITSGKTITKSQGYTLTHQGVTGASKILYGVYGANNKYVHKEQNPGTQCVFTAAELAELGTTKNGMIQVNAYTITDDTQAGKKVYYVRQYSYTITGVEIK